MGLYWFSNKHLIPHSIHFLHNPASAAIVWRHGLAPIQSSDLGCRAEEDRELVRMCCYQKPSTERL